jgi:hypothetical protein
MEDIFSVSEKTKNPTEFEAIESDLPHLKKYGHGLTAKQRNRRP